MDTNKQSSDEKQVHGYQTMMDRVKQALQHAQKDTLPGIGKHIDNAVEKAVELEELSREEAEQVGDYLRRDLKAAAEFLEDTRDELVDWIRFDTALIEDRLLQMFALMVDHTREELGKLEARAHSLSEWRTGEITGPGTLHCADCGKAMNYRKPGRIPPCPACHHTKFKREPDD